MRNLSKTIANLRKLASSGTGPEASTAAAALREFEKKYPDAAQAADAAAVPDVDRWFAARNRHDRALLVQVCLFMGCKAFQLRGKRASSGVIFRGPEPLVGAAAAVVDYLRGRLDELHWGVTMGFVSGALPIPDDAEEESTAPAAARKRLSEEALAAGAAAYAAGRRANPRQALSAPDVSVAQDGVQ